MEAVVLEDSPLADYLEGRGGNEDTDSIPDHDVVSTSSDPSFAPRGWPTIRAKFKQKLPPPLQLAIPGGNPVDAIQKTCSRALNQRIGRADNSRFLEQFRYIIVASQLLNAHAYIGQGSYGQSKDPLTPQTNTPAPITLTYRGIAIALCFPFVLAWFINWTRVGSTGGHSVRGKCRMVIFVALIFLFSVVGYAYLRRKRLQFLRQQTLEEISNFVVTAHKFDAAVMGAMALVQEVELVSRGYSISNPLPPISRLEDKSQTRRCIRLRKQLRLCFAEIIPQYNRACCALKPFTDEIDLERYYDIYDIGEADISDSISGYIDQESEDSQSVRILKISAARYHTARKILLCCLMALEANGGKTDFDPWKTAFGEIQGIQDITNQASSRLCRILAEEENFPVPATPKLPLTPGRERWRAQMRKLNSLSTGIRGLQAKLHVLREESDRHLDESEEVAELGTTLMIQYESIGVDLKALMQEWEDGKAALASNIDRNERRISSMSGMLSPTSSLGGLTAVEEGGALEALNALNGERRSRSSMEFSSSDVEEVFEAISVPRQRSSLTREERIAKMKEDRIKRDSLKSSKEANTKMLRELESVINMRPRGKINPGGRITSI